MFFCIRFFIDARDGKGDTRSNSKQLENEFSRIAQEKTKFALDFLCSLCYTIGNHFETEDFVTMDDGDGADCNRSRAKTTYVACETRTCKAFLRSHIGYRYAFLQFLRLLT